MRSRYADNGNLQQKSKSDIMNPNIDTLEKLVHQAKDTWEDEAFQQRLQEIKARLLQKVRKNPAGSVGVAFLAGFLIGKVTKRSTRE